jgi:4'-phosphopantetheinyl transferase
MLDQDERSRATGFIEQRACERFLAAHIALRMILARYAGTTDLNLTRSSHGKPALAGHLSWLRFNLAHTEDLALIACARDREVGVDVEYIRPHAADEAIASQQFSSNEQTQLRALLPERWPAGFFACWTRKEAYVKARGLGLSLHLADFDVPIDPEIPMTRIIHRSATDAGRDWWLQDLPLGTSYAAAVAAEGSGWQVHALDWCWIAGRA